MRPPLDGGASCHFDENRCAQNNGVMMSWRPRASN